MDAWAFVGIFHGFFAKNDPSKLAIEVLASWPSPSRTFLQKESPFSIIFKRGRFGYVLGQFRASHFKLNDAMKIDIKPCD